MSPGTPSIKGGAVSATVMRCETLALLPDESAALYSTTVVPVWYRPLDDRLCARDGDGS